MAQSLLAHMYSHIRGSQEDIATYSLEYIISQSSELNDTFTKLLENSLHESLGSNIHYNCQATGKNKERPDISGVDSDSKEVVLCEAKFYAGLTENQPNAYLDRLKNEGGKGLVFICPTLRRRNLWSRLVELCNNKSLNFVDEYCVTVDGVRMSIITWSEIIEKLRSVASSVAVASLSDIDQLDGFCKLMDDSSFIPFKEEDFGPENARREERHYQVLDTVVSKLLSEKSLNASTKGLKATAYRHGYVRYIIVLGHALAIAYDRTNWRDSSTVETPFWVAVYEKDFKQPSVFVNAFSKYPASYRRTTSNGLFLPLFAPIGAALDEIAKELSSQIVSYIQDVQGIMES